MIQRAVEEYGNLQYELWSDADVISILYFPKTCP